MIIKPEFHYDPMWGKEFTSDITTDFDYMPSNEVKQVKIAVFKVERNKNKIISAELIKEMWIGPDYDPKQDTQLAQYELDELEIHVLTTVKF